MISPSDHLWRHVLNGPAEGVGPVLSLVWEKLPAKLSSLILCHRYINSRLWLSVCSFLLDFLFGILLSWLYLPWEPKVRKGDVTITIKKNVFQLDVPVDDTILRKNYENICFHRNYCFIFCHNIIEFDFTLCKCCKAKTISAM